MTASPFRALGLPERPDLTDEQVRAAWRYTAAATHPDRRDGGNITRYTAAASAYAQLRTPWGRTEAYADLTASPAAPPCQPAAAGETAPPAPPGARARQVLSAARLLPARARHGRPARLALRAAAAAALALAAVRLTPGAPAAPALVTGIITWWLLTTRHDLAPAPGR